MEETDDDNDDDDLYSDIAEVEYEYDEEDYEDADEENEARSVPTDPLGIIFFLWCLVWCVMWCGVWYLGLLNNIIFIARSGNPLLQKSAQSPR